MLYGINHRRIIFFTDPGPQAHVASDVARPEPIMHQNLPIIISRISQIIYILSPTHFPHTILKSDS